MKTFKWTVPEPSDPQRMNRREYEHWARVRARGAEWFVVHKGLTFVAVIPAASAFTSGSGLTFELGMLSWLAGLTMGTLVWLRRESRFGRARDEGMRVSGDDAPD